MTSSKVHIGVFLKIYSIGQHLCFTSHLEHIKIKNTILPYRKERYAYEMNLCQGSFLIVYH
jgi:hypothetical protein